MSPLQAATTSRSYGFGSSRLVIRFQDIVQSDAEVLVSSDDYMLSMGGGVSAAISSAAGDALLLDAAKSRPRSLGDVVVTTAGALSARYVFHGITIGQVGQRRPPVDVVRTITRRCMQIARSLGVSSIAFPALGTGAAGFGMADSAVAMAQTVTEELSSAGERMTVTVCLQAREFTDPLDYIHFYEEFARRVPEVAQHETPAREPDVRLVPQVDAPAPGRRHVLDLVALERRRNDLETRIDLARRHGDAAQMAQLREEYVRNLDERQQVASNDPARTARGYRVFISYAREDERWSQELSKHLSGLRSSGVIESWHDRLIVAGTDWDREIDRNLRHADVVLFLVSADFLASEYIASKEVTTALRRHEAGEAVAVPVILRPVDWGGTPLARLQALPRDGLPVTRWSNADEALVDVVRGLRELTVRLRELRSQGMHPAEP